MNQSENKHKKFEFVGMGFRIKPCNSEAEDESSGIRQASFRRIGEQFSTKLLLLWTYMNRIGRVANATTFTNMASALALIFDVIDAAKQQSNTLPLAEVEFEIYLSDGENDKRKIRTTQNVYETKHLKSLLQYGRFHDAALRILYESALQQIVNAYERLVGDLIRWHLTDDPEAAPKDQVITYRELLQFQDIEEAKRRVIQNVLTEFIRNKSASQQLEYFREHFNIDVKSLFPKMAEFEELVLRRHAIVHAGGIITPEYLRRVRSLKNLPFQVGSEGELVELDKFYIESAWSTVYALGTILLHLIARQSARNRKLKEEEDQADLFVIMYPFRALQEKIYTAAELILNYAKDLRLANSTNELMVKINLAQTMKWQNREEDAKALLELVDWRATSNLFRTCVAALTNPEEFGDLLNAAVRDNDLSLEHLYEWPVFTAIREDPRFPEWVQRAFGNSSSPTANRFPPSLLNFGHEVTLEEIFNYIGSRSSIKIEKAVDLERGIKQMVPTTAPVNQPEK